MYFSFSPHDIKTFLPQLGQQAGAAIHSNCYESILNLPSHVGDGFLYRIELRPGLEFRIKNAIFLEPFKLEMQDSLPSSSLAIHFCLAGYIRRTFHGKVEFNLDARQSSLSFASNIVGTREWKPQQRITYVEINLEMAVLDRLIDRQWKFLPEALKPLIKGNHEGDYFQSGWMDNSMTQIVRQVLDCPYQGLTRRLYLEGKAMELLALRLDTSFCQRSLDAMRLRSDDLDRLYYARDILLRDLEHPPSLLKLAQEVGLNDYKLKRGFQQVFGTTVFGCLHDYRMQRAYQLLETGVLNITEVSLEVGYNSLSSFNRAFKKKFGTNPSHVCNFQG